MIVINLFAGPGAGKSTLAAGIFYELKMKGVNCELVREYAKDKVWEESTAILDDQVYVFGKQFHRMNIVANKVDVVVTDSPLLLSMYYAKQSITPEFHALILREFRDFNNVNFFINRKKPYDERGRLQNESEARAIDGELHRLLCNNDVDYTIIDGNRGGLDDILSYVTVMLR
jgi:nicotinamide riboside kinase